MADDESQQTSAPTPAAPAPESAPAGQVSESPVSDSTSEHTSAVIEPVPESPPSTQTAEQAVESPPPPLPSEQSVAPPLAAAPPLPPPATATAARPAAGAHMRDVARKRKQERLEKIVQMSIEKRIITNNDVEKLLKVSDASATNYLRELVLAGRLKKSGVRASTRYEPT